MSFDPFLNAELITDEMVNDAKANLDKIVATRDAFLATPAPDTLAAYLEAQRAAQLDSVAIATTIWTQPVLVHVAGPREKLHDADNPHEHWVQRCVRCGSELMGYCSSGEPQVVLDPETGPRIASIEDFGWWPPGSRVAKAVTPDESAATAFAIDPSGEPDRELQSWEHECRDMSDLTVPEHQING